MIIAINIYIYIYIFLFRLWLQYICVCVWTCFSYYSIFHPCICCLVSTMVLAHSKCRWSLFLLWWFSSIHMYLVIWFQLWYKLIKIFGISFLSWLSIDRHGFTLSWLHLDRVYDLFGYCWPCISLLGYCSCMCVNVFSLDYKQIIYMICFLLLLSIIHVFVPSLKNLILAMAVQMHLWCL